MEWLIPELTQIAVLIRRFKTIKLSALLQTCSIPLDSYPDNQDGNFTTLGYTTSSASHKFIEVLSRYEMFTAPCVFLLCCLLLLINVENSSV